MKGLRTIILNQGSADEVRQRIREYFHATFSIDEKLYESLAGDEVFYLRADPLRHPLVFYLGHTAVFYVNKLNIARILSRRINPRFESIFAVGVDEMSWDDLNEAHYDWPGIPEVRAYRDQVRALVDDLITQMPLEMPITWESPWWAIMMGIEHQRIHLETSSVLIRHLPLDKVKELDFFTICPQSGDAPLNSLVNVPGGEVTIGKGDDDTHYGWDNEYGRARYQVKDFKASKYLCSNQEFLGFIEAGGYHEERWWTPEGWAWKSYQQAEMPRFWQKEGDKYLLRTMASLIELPRNWPVEINYLEAKAFCNWKAELMGKPIRLPMEEEWYLMRDRLVNEEQSTWAKAPGNINLEYWASPCPVDHFAFGDIYDLIGNVWQWTETPIYGLPGFKIHPVYDDFSTPTFDGKHNLIKGGSWISTGNEALRDSRYAFRRHFYQHAGFRYVESEAEPVNHDVYYESDKEVCRAADMDWGIERKPENEYPASLILAIAGIIEPGNQGKVLHIGCKTGRTSFELARFYEHVTGVDFTARMIRLATEMKEQGYIRYLRDEEGEIQSFAEARLADYDLEELAKRCEFWQADASNLVPKFSGYNLIVVDGTLSRTNNPGALLSMIHERMNSGAYLVISDDWDWQESSTNKDNWLGGIRKDGEPFSSLEGLTELLSDRFELLGSPIDLAKLQPLNARRYIHGMQQVTIWKLK